MHTLLTPFARAGQLLARDRDDLYEHLQEFLLAEVDGRLVGLVALHVYGPDLAELRSLAVADGWQGRGVGRRLVARAEQWARRLGVRRLFALTYTVSFFERCGYRVVARESLPHKVWTVCIHCDHFSRCDEVAVAKDLAASAQRSEPSPDP